MNVTDPVIERPDLDAIKSRLAEDRAKVNILKVHL
jgi:hypothetical protein